LIDYKTHHSAQRGTHCVAEIKLVIRTDREFKSVLEKEEFFYAYGFYMDYFGYIVH